MKKDEAILRSKQIRQQKKKRVLLALDPAEKFGWAISNDLYGTWNFKLKKDESFSMKLIRLRAKLKEMLHLNSISIVVFERPSGHHANAIISHSKFVGIIEMLCTEENIPYKGYSAKEIKKFATNNGNAGKPLMIKKAQELLGYKGEDDNEADALWLLNLAKQDLSL